MTGFSSSVISYTQSFWGARKSKYEDFNRRIDEAESRLEVARPGSDQEAQVKGELYMIYSAKKYEKDKDFQEWRKGLRNHR